MGRYDYGYYGFAPYVSVAEKKKRNQKAAAKLRNKNKNARPVVVEGRAIAKSWWGKHWNDNLERYADYANRVGRGRSYVRHGAVLDLRIEKGVVHALAQGSRGAPYEVAVTIKKLSSEVWKDLREASLASLHSLNDLLAGKFPEDLKDTFFEKGTGLFPSPKEIGFECSCPDWASMCKHVAAVLYGVGNRLDDSPELFFELRQVTIDDLISETVKTTSKNLMDKAEGAAGDDVLADADLADVFGIEMDDAVPAAPPMPSVTKSKSSKVSEKRAKYSKTTPRANAARKKKSKKRSAKRAAPKKNDQPARGQMIHQLMKSLGRSKKSFQTDDLIEKLPDWTKSQVTATLQRAIIEGRVDRVSRGVYKRR